MADEVYDGAIGIDLGERLPQRPPRPAQQALTDRRHDLLMRRQL
jgi:hypothetical protein